MFHRLLLLAALASAPAQSPIVFSGDAEVVHPGLVSTAKTEIRIAFSPDGTRMLWGAIGWDGGKGAWDIWESVNADGIWQTPRPVPFNSSYKDFDPFFAREGVFFFSNRPGGAGGDDIYFASYDRATGQYGAPHNLGPAINSKGDEWAPTLSRDGSTLLFASDGRGGQGLHDLFVAERTNDGWSEAQALPRPLNSTEDDFDAAWLHDGRTLVFSRKPGDREEMHLYVSRVAEGAWSEPTRLEAAVNVPRGWNLGPAIDPATPGILYFTSHREGTSQGQLDVYRIRYATAASQE
jgi:Tol biopolymer transport system component